MRLRLTLSRALTAATLAGGCKATTSRPTFVPLPESEHGELGLGLPNRDTSVVRITRTVVAALQADSVPLARVHERDGYFDSGWLDSGTLRPTGRRPLGPDVVRVRGWVDPGKPGYSNVELETVFIPVADPSRPPRDLEVALPADHPVAKRIARLMKDLIEKYGDPADQAKIAPAAGGPPLKQPADSAAAKSDSTARRDTTAVKRDTTAVKRDTTAKRDTSGTA